MVCFHPLKGWRARLPSGNGGYRIVFNIAAGFVDKPQSVPCGQCTGCRLERSRQWAVRCMHEASLHADNCFLTLTYSDEHVPRDGSLRIRDVQLFLKRLRSRYGAGIRFYGCGEYGDNFGRPHYHLCVFGFDFGDKVAFSKNSQGDIVYISRELDDVWGFGISTIGAVTFESAAYVARYVMKKVTGKGASDYYERYNLDTGEIYWLSPEYTHMSRRSGIGKDWFDKFTSDVYPRDYVVVNGVKSRPPRFYDSKFEIIDPARYARLKARRVRNARLHAEDNTPERLRVREEVVNSRISKLKREIG